MNRSIRFLLLNSLLLVSVFLFSVWIRHSNLSAPIGRHHEFITGHVLVSLDMWEKNGAWSHYFSSTLSYDKPADLATNMGTMKDSRGVKYYVSYPPLAFILPYFFIQLTGNNVSIQLLHIYTLLNHFLTATVLFLLVVKIFNQKITEQIPVAPFMAFIVFIYSAGALWFYSNVYFVDMQVNIFVLLLMWKLVDVYQDPALINSIKSNFWIAVWMFLGLYTEWLAAFIGFVMVLFFLWKFKAGRAFVWPVVSILTGGLLAITLIIVQYSCIAGFTTLIGYWKEIFLYRAGISEGVDQLHWGNAFTWEYLWGHYVYNFKFTLYLLAACIVLLGIVYATKRQLLSGITTPVLWCIGLLSGGIILHNIVFFNFNVMHDFSTVKSLMPIALIVATTAECMTRIGRQYRFGFVKIGVLLAVPGLVIFYMNQSVYSYLRKHYSPVCYSIMLGTHIQQWVKPDEAVFAISGNPEALYYGKRTIHQVKSEEEAIAILKKANYEKGVYYDIPDDRASEIRSVTRIFKDGRKEPLAGPYVYDCSYKTFDPVIRD